ncbi:TPA: ATP-grasp domain-containing protein, partial [Listeria innocua]|nr:ATP-grasp domain-containing protein [Listeria innocua]
IDSIDNKQIIITDFSEGWISDVEKRLELGKHFVFTLEENLLSYANHLAEYFGTELCVDMSIFVDKKKMKKFFLENDINTPIGKPFGYNKYDDIDLKFPFIIKPIKGAASLGVRLIDDNEQLNDQIKKIALLNKLVLNDSGNEFMVEEYIAGEEYSVDLLWLNGKVIDSIVAFKGEIKGPTFYDRGYYIMNDKTAVYKRLVDFSQLIGEKMGAKHGCTHTEIKIFKDKLYCIETTMRPGGGGILLELSSDKNNDFEKFFLQCIANEVPNVARVTRESKHIYWFNTPFWFALPKYRSELEILKEKFNMQVEVRSYINENVDENKEEFTLGYKNVLICHSSENSEMNDFVKQFNEAFNHIKKEQTYEIS